MSCYRIPVIAAANRAVRRAINFYERIKNDVLAFYNSIVDAITVDLPWAAQQLAKGINQIWDAIRSLKKSPGKSIQDIISSVFSIQSAVKVVIAAKQRVWDAMFFRNGKAWWNNLVGISSHLSPGWPVGLRGKG